VDLPETKTHFVNHPQRLLREQPTDKEEDETLEVLITDLDEKNARQFYLKDASAVAEGWYLKKARKARKNAVHADRIGADGRDIGVGNKVVVPGDMHSVVKLIGIVNGKKGMFAGVQLSREYASRRKNDGEVIR
jgi:hypothetical protein